MSELNLKIANITCSIESDLTTVSEMHPVHDAEQMAELCESIAQRCKTVAELKNQVNN